MAENSSGSSPTRWAVAGAFGSIYFFWGSVFLAIAFAIETIPPFLMMGVRLVLAGAMLIGWARLRGAAFPAGVEWRGIVLGATLLFYVGVAVGAWGQLWLPSGLTGVVIATVPLWMVLLNWWAYGGQRPAGRILLGLLLGLFGIVLVVGPDALRPGPGAVSVFGVGVMLVATVGWAAGSVITSHTRQPESVMMTAGMQMLIGGGLSLLTAVAGGDVARFDPDLVSARSVAAMAYLVVFPGVVAFSAYLWLLRVSSTARVATFAYVNPVVALFFGWALGGEDLSVRTVVAAAIILFGVVLIATRPAREPVRDPATSGD